MRSNDHDRIVAIGDIHGCIHALDALVDAICPQPDDMIVVLGDFIDMGWATRDVIDRLIHLDGRCRLVCLQGNHEEMMLAALSNPGLQSYWQQCGGIATLNSYRFGADLDEIPDEHVQFVSRCLDYYETQQHIFVHASFVPHLPMPRQSSRQLRWEAIEPPGPGFHVSGKTVIAGHTEQTSGEILDLGCVQCIDTACWRYGWLTALDVTSGHVWQASRFGQLRFRDEPPVGPIRDRQASPNGRESKP